MKYILSHIISIKTEADVSFHSARAPMMNGYINQSQVVPDYSGEYIKCQFNLDSGLVQENLQISK